MLLYLRGDIVIKSEMYELMNSQLKALLQGESNRIANMANASALIYQTLEDLNWAGFYLYDRDNNDLVLGPFQGKVACMHIPMNKGVCGSAAYQRKTLVVDDVHQFEGHIACDSASNSEIVIPIIKNNQLLGVLDIDSPNFNRFDNTDKTYLEKFIAILINFC